ncbi:hypothetical protein HanXRQr2_Chr09g0368851 [Helianthus annuus]|uniref:Uncharacterized protein n=1 Tax=Helianthus annuus TaxID=4232 RepID=A0A9K3I361_HELAN|nr:hypothetical protein HanXRQr2_Chr09g0368851 [Helianthus annuus]
MRSNKHQNNIMKCVKENQIWSLLLVRAIYATLATFMSVSVHLPRDNFHLFSSKSRDDKNTQVRRVYPRPNTNVTGIPNTRWLWGQVWD